MKRYFKRIFVAWSIFWNTIFGGRNNQTVSARMWQRKRDRKWHIVPIIDRLFWWEKGHCQDSWVKWTIINHAIRRYDNHMGFGKRNTFHWYE